MSRTLGMRWWCLLWGLVLLGCGGAPTPTPSGLVPPLQESPGEVTLTRELNEQDLPLAIRNMPMNDGVHCMGISLVVEAVLEANLVDDYPKNSLAEVAAEIYAQRAQGRLDLPTTLHDGADHYPIRSEAGLKGLAPLVNERYQQDHRRLLDQESPAEVSHLSSLQELERALAQDADGIVVFCGDGTRTFAGLLSKPTSHAFLISKQATKYVVFDSNDPGRMIDCEITEEEGGVLASWKCKYRDIAEDAEHSYWLLHADELFRVVKEQRE